MIQEFWNQTVAVIRIEFAKTFLARRSIWIYVLALLPAILLYGNSIYAKRDHQRLVNIAASHAVDPEVLRSIRPGLTMEDLVKRLGEPYQRTSRIFWAGRPPRQHERLTIKYSDGQADISFLLNDGILQGIGRRTGQDLPQLLLVFASVFQLYFIRLAIFFGCAGIFTNLFRGEMLDKSLHFYLLAPVPRPILVLGKYVAGLLATSVIFSASTGLQFYALLRGFDSATVQQYLQSGGWSQIFSYVTVAALACAAYGSIFLAAGLVANNPAVPAAFILLWESVNAFIPGSLKMASIVFYLQSLCPIEAPPDRTIPPVLQALVAPVERVGTFTSLAVLAGAAILVIVMSGFHARRLEINYSAD